MVIREPSVLDGTFWVQVLTWKYRLILCLGTMNLVHAATRLHRIFRWWGLIRWATVCALWGWIADDDPSLMYPDLSIYFSSSGIHSSPWYLYCIVFQVCTRPPFWPPLRSPCLSVYACNLSCLFSILRHMGCIYLSSVISGINFFYIFIPIHMWSLVKSLNLSRSIRCH